MTTDEEAREFLDSDLSDLDFSQFRPARYEFARKSARLTMRLPEALLDAVKTEAEKHGIPYQRYIRETLERSLMADQHRE
ncbi:MAG: CopG family antitoxin [Geminicoccaceae bacterium]